MNYKQAIKYIESVSWKGSVPGLERIGELCEKLGHPERRTKFVHVAGTNGKGSVCAMISSVLHAAGYKTGLFTSPHLIEYTERFSVDGKNIGKNDFCTAAETVKEAAKDMRDAPTEFEILTAMAFVYFAKKGCDIAVLECGMGGRLDATNIIEEPVLSVITNIALDHTSVLGNTEVDIAAEKAGIIKGSPFVAGKISADVEDYLKDVSIKRRVRMISYSSAEISDERLTDDGISFSYRGTEMMLPLFGAYQSVNLRTAIECLEALKESGYKISDDDLKLGLASVRWIGRFEKLSADPVFIFDGAHNPDGAVFTSETFRKLYPGEKAVLITGVMADKDYRSIARILAPVAYHVYTVSPDNSRALSAEEYAKVFGSLGITAFACKSVSEAVSKAIGEASSGGCPILCAGSLYMYAEIVSALQSQR